MLRNAILISPPTIQGSYIRGVVELENVTADTPKVRVRGAGALDFKERLPALDGLRGVAIIGVFFYHYAGGIGAHATSGIARSISNVVGLGWTGVDLFFVLSGFLITGILYDTLRDPEYFRNFYVRRTLRIFPIYYAAILIAFCVGELLRIHWKLAHLSFVFYIGYPTALIWPALTQVGPIRITHLWSLSVEEQFYLGWPWLISRLKTPARIVTGCGIIALSAFSLRVALLKYLGSDWPYAFIFCRADALAIGAALAIAVRTRSARIVKRFAPMLTICASAGFIIMCAIRQTGSHSDSWMCTVGFTLLALGYGGLLLMALGPLKPIFSAGILRMFGKYSYGLYLYHFPLSVILSPLRQPITARVHSYVLGGFIFVIFSLMLNLLIAAASYRYFESPIMRLKQKFAYSSEKQHQTRTFRSRTDAAKEWNKADVLQILEK